MKLSAFRPLRNSMKEEDLLGYDEDVLDRLTWNNLGWRLGKVFGETSEERKQEILEWCIEQRKE
jgi:hypothetical protein